MIHHMPDCLCRAGSMAQTVAGNRSCSWLGAIGLLLRQRQL
jgi:hypothetical protein